MELIGLFLAILAFAVFLLPVVAMVAASRAQNRVRELETRVAELLAARVDLDNRVFQLERRARDAAEPERVPASAAAERRPEPVSVSVAVERGPEPVTPPASLPEAGFGAPPAAEPPRATDHQALSALRNLRERAERDAPAAPPTVATPSDEVSEPAVSPSTAPPPSGASPEPPANVDWERWLGVRGAAALGGIVFALAAILFFRYAIERGLISPPLRVVLGVVAGLGCLAGSEKLRARYADVANALAGGGVVALYAAFWAARVLYELVSFEVAFGLMALTTAACCLLATRNASLLVAVLGLTGGFLTPLLLSTGSDRPIALFGYVLLLNIGFVLAARRRGWPIVNGLALAFTLLLEGVWVVLRMGPDRVGLGLGIVALFAICFALAGAGIPAERRRPWLLAQASGLLAPFGFGIYFASRAELGARLWPIALLLALLSLAAGWVQRSDARARWLPLAAAGASTAVVAVWLVRNTLDARAAWDAALSAIGIGLAFLAAIELSRDPESRREPSLAAAASALGLFACLVAASAGAAEPQLRAWLTGWVGLAALLILHAARFRKDALIVAAAAALAAAFTLFWRAHAGDARLPSLSGYFAIQIGLSIAFHLVALAIVRPLAQAAAAALPLGLLLGLLVQRIPLVEGSPVVVLGPTLALGVLAVFGATRLGDGRWILVCGALLAGVQVTATDVMSLDAATALPAFGLELLAVAFFAFWPLAVHGRLIAPRFAFYTAALAGPAWFFALRRAYGVMFGEAAIGLLPLGLAALAVFVLFVTQRKLVLEASVRRSAVVWQAAVALGFVSVAIPLQLDRQWITIGWAFESCFVLLLFRRLDHAGLKWFGLVLAALVTVRLVLNPAVLEYAEQSAWPVLNWLLYTYGVPAALLFAGSAVLRPIELERQRPWEAGWYAKGHPAGAIGLVVCVIAIVFAWLNLTIFDAFDGTRGLFELERRPARDLTISLAWAVYAGLLLGMGMIKSSRGLRWLSLGFLILTIGKVFLYDLGQLRDLYRVLSLLGLAVSLIAVSLAYQRFVFSRTTPARSA